MSAAIALRGTRPCERWIETASQKDREPTLCWHELIQLALCGILPTDLRLENLLDRCERLS